MGAHLEGGRIREDLIRRYTVVPIKILRFVAGSKRLELEERYRCLYDKRAVFK